METKRKNGNKEKLVTYLVTLMKKNKTGYKPKLVTRFVFMVRLEEFESPAF